MTAAGNQTHTGGSGAPTAGSRTTRGRIGDLWVTILTALPGAARVRPSRADGGPVPATVPAPPAQPAGEPDLPEEQVGWPTWRGPR